MSIKSFLFKRQTKDKKWWRNKNWKDFVYSFHQCPCIFTWLVKTTDMSNTYTYINEDEIDPELFCTICRQPYDEPVCSQQCQHIFCRKCILACLNEQTRCPLCRFDAMEEDFQLVNSWNLFNQLDCLRVSCDACRMKNIRRNTLINVAPGWPSLDPRSDWH